MEHPSLITAVLAGHEWRVAALRAHPELEAHFVVRLACTGCGRRVCVIAAGSWRCGEIVDLRRVAA